MINRLAIYSCRKCTDCNAYLHFKSFHPTHLKKNLPLGNHLGIRGILLRTSNIRTIRAFSMNIKDIPLKSLLSRIDREKREALLNSKKNKRKGLVGD